MGNEQSKGQIEAHQLSSLKNYCRLVQLNDSEKDGLFSDRSAEDLTTRKQSHNTRLQPYRRVPTRYQMKEFECLLTSDMLVNEREERIGEQFGSYEEGQSIFINEPKHSRKPSESSASSQNQLNVRQSVDAGPQFKKSTSLRQSANSVKFETYRTKCNGYVIAKRYGGSSSATSLSVTNYFLEEHSMQNYVSNLIKLKQRLSNEDCGGSSAQVGCQIYKDFNIVVEEPLFIVERNMAEGVELSPENRVSKKVLRSNPNVLFEFLELVAAIGSRFENIVIHPEDVYLQEGEMLLLDFKYANESNSPALMTLAVLIDWVYNEDNELQELTFEQFWTKKNRFSEADQNLSVTQSATFQAVGVPLYIRNLYFSILSQRIDRCEMYEYVNRLKNKSLALNHRIDSFHACINQKKTWLFSEEKHPWLMGKRENELYFYNLEDDHRCYVKVIRKNKKIDLEGLKIMFDPEELEVKYVAENSKLIIHVAEFELEKSSCISDIQIKHKLPIKFKNPSLFYSRKKSEMIIMEGSVYRYNPKQNKIYQETKKITDAIYLARNSEHMFAIVKLSIDIFKNGIRMYFDQKEVDLMFIADQNTTCELANLRVDIRSVEFCKEIYKGVYLMLANKNIWVLDLNFSVFFSYATPERVKRFYGFASKSGHSLDEQDQYVFQIFNQNFRAEFLSQQQGNNVKIKDEFLHIIGESQGKLYYLRYLFLPESGSLKLTHYKALCGQTPLVCAVKVDMPEQPCKAQMRHSRDKSSNLSNILKQKNLQLKVSDKAKKKVKIASENFDDDEESENVNPLFAQSKGLQQQQDHIEKAMQKEELQSQKYCFNFHEESLEYYKCEKWLYGSDEYFICPSNFDLRTSRTSYEIELTIPKLKYSLKDLMEKIKRENEGSSNGQNAEPKYSTHRFSKQEILFYCLRMIDIYTWLMKNQLLHRNISVHNLYFTERENSLKLIGWSEPSRNWYVSDYKDVLLTFFNIITFSSFEKLTEKVIQKYSIELQQFPPIYEKMSTSFKFAKTAEKKNDIEKDLLQMKEYIKKELSVYMLESKLVSPVTEKPKEEPLIFSKRGLAPRNRNMPKTLNVPPLTDEVEEPEKQQYSSVLSKEFIFNFEFNTPRLSMVSILKGKMKKIRVLLDENSQEELIFKSSDKQLWNEQQNCLYIFTSSYKFYEIKINTANFMEDVVVCEEYEYLPHNILESSFIHIPKSGIYSFGGIYKKSKSNGELLYNHKVYKFNSEKLTWDIVLSLPFNRVNPYLVLNQEVDSLYILGGETTFEQQKLTILKVNLEKLRRFQEKSLSVKYSEKEEDQASLQSSQREINTSQPCNIFESFVDPHLDNPLKNLKIPLFPLKIFCISSAFEIFLMFYLSNDKYSARIFCLNSFCLDLQLEAQNYSDDNSSKVVSADVGIVMNGNFMHILKPYGRYVKININRLESLLMTNQTLYGDRQRKDD